MHKAALSLAAVLLGAVAVRAEEPVSFEALLDGVRLEVQETRAEQVEAKNQSRAQEIDRLARDLNRLDWDARRLRDRVGDLRRRANMMGRNQPQPRPGQPPRPSDPFFRNDLQRAVWDIRDFKRDVELGEQTATRYAREATPDPVLVGPAQNLQRESYSLDSETGWLESEARWARMDLQRAGYTWEGYDIEREADDARRASQDLARSARDLLNRVR